MNKWSRAPRSPVPIPPGMLSGPGGRRRSPGKYRGGRTPGEAEEDDRVNRVKRRHDHSAVEDRLDQSQPAWRALQHFHHDTALSARVSDPTSSCQWPSRRVRPGRRTHTIWWVEVQTRATCGSSRQTIPCGPLSRLVPLPGSGEALEQSHQIGTVRPVRIQGTPPGGSSPRSAPDVLGTLDVAGASAILSRRNAAEGRQAWVSLSPPPGERGGPMTRECTRSIWPGHDNRVAPTSAPAARTPPPAPSGSVPGHLRNAPGCNRPAGRRASATLRPASRPDR